MTGGAAAADQPPLGGAPRGFAALAAVGETLRLYFSSLLFFFAVGWAASLASWGVLVGIHGLEQGLLISDFGPLALGLTGLDAAAALLAAYGAPFLTAAYAAAVITSAAADKARGAPISPARHLAAGARLGHMVIGVSIVAGLTIALGLTVLILPGLWLLGALAVTTPAVVLERRGFSALSRSADVTKGRRWPVLGAFLLVVLIAAALAIGPILADLALADAQPTGGDGAPAAQIHLARIAALSFAEGVLTSLTAVFAVVAHRRLTAPHDAAAARAADVFD